MRAHAPAGTALGPSSAGTRGASPPHPHPSAHRAALNGSCLRQEGASSGAAVLSLASSQPPCLYGIWTPGQGGQQAPGEHRLPWRHSPGPSPAWATNQKEQIWALGCRAQWGKHMQQSGVRAPARTEMQHQRASHCCDSLWGQEHHWGHSPPQTHTSLSSQDSEESLTPRSLFTQPERGQVLGPTKYSTLDNSEPTAGHMLSQAGHHCNRLCHHHDQLCN